MDPEHRRVLEENAKYMKDLEINKLKPLLLKVRIFTGAMLKDINDVAELFQELPTRGPTAFANFIKVLKEAGYPAEGEILDNFGMIKKFETNCVSQYYTMSSKPLGYCLIINNVIFKCSNLKNREGAEVDLKDLSRIFEEIGYSITSETDLNAEDMKAVLRAFSRRDFTNVDSCIVIILSHGSSMDNLDYLCGTDGLEVYKNDIVSLFSNENCESLQNKPKMFFFQACRGEEKDFGVPVESRKKPRESTDGVSYSDYSLYPQYSDIYVVHSTLPRKLSVRDHDKGTWFCQDLVQVLAKGYRSTDLQSMMLSVNEKMFQRVSQELKKQVLHTEDLGLRKKIKFRP